MRAHHLGNPEREGTKSLKRKIDRRKRDKLTNQDWLFGKNRFFNLGKKDIPMNMYAIEMMSCASIVEALSCVKNSFYYQKFSRSEFPSLWKLYFSIWFQIVFLIFDLLPNIIIALWKDSQWIFMVELQNKYYNIL